MIIFKKIVVEGFGSIVLPQTFNLDKKGLFIIRGKNGHGKTTLFSAMYWVLYKENLKEIKNAGVVTWEERRTAEFRGTRVVLDFDIVKDETITTYRIARHINFTGTTAKVKGGSSLMVFENGELVPEALHKRDIQGFINKLLGMDAKVFINSILFGQRMARLISAPNDDKRKLLEEIAELHFIEDAKEKGKKASDQMLTDISSLNAKISSAKTNIESINREIKIIQDTTDSFELDKKNRLTTLQNTIRELQDSIENSEFELHNKEKELAELIKTTSTDPTEEYQALTSIISTLETELLTLQRKEESEKTAKITKAQASLDEYRRVIASETHTLKINIEDQIASVNRLINSKTDIARKISETERELKEVKETCPYCDGKLLKEKVQAVKDKIQEKLTLLETSFNEGSTDSLPTLGLLQKNLNKKLDDLQFRLKKPDTSEIILVDQLEASKTKIPISKEEHVLGIKLRDKKNKQQELKGIIDSAEENKKKVTGLTSEIAVIKSRIDIYDKTMATRKAEVKAEQDKKLPPNNLQQLVEDKEALEFSLVIKEKDVVTITNRKAKYDWWVSKGFGSSGLKSFVFNAMLDNLNRIIEMYASRLGTRVKFSIDLSMASKPFVTTVYKEGIERDYNDLSGGEKQRIDICLAFAMFDLVSGTNNTNLLILDEVLEGLDEEGIEQVFDLVRLKAGADKAVYMITHHASVDTHMSRNLYVEWDGITSTISEVA